MLFALCLRFVLNMGGEQIMSSVPICAWTHCARILQGFFAFGLYCLAFAWCTWCGEQGGAGPKWGAHCNAYNALGFWVRMFLAIAGFTLVIAMVAMYHYSILACAHC